jgi:hypothetical protein
LHSLNVKVLKAAVIVYLATVYHGVVLRRSVDLSDGLTLDARRITLIPEGSYVPQKLTRPDFLGRDDKDEYATFEAALKKVLSVPRSAIKARLDAERPVRKRRKRVSSRASRDKG